MEKLLSVGRFIMAAIGVVIAVLTWMSVTPSDLKDFALTNWVIGISVMGAFFVPALVCQAILMEVRLKRIEDKENQLEGLASRLRTLEDDRATASSIIKQIHGVLEMVGKLDPDQRQAFSALLSPAENDATD